jgi:PAS domain S-box-containing protein
MKNTNSIARTIWLSLGIFLLGYVISIISGLVLGKRTEAMLLRVAEVRFPVAKMSEAALVSFKEQIRIYSDAILTGDTDMLKLSESRARETKHQIEQIVLLQPEDGLISRSLMETAQALDRFSGQANQLYTQMIVDYDSLIASSNRHQKVRALADETERLQKRLEEYAAGLSGDLKNDLAQVKRMHRQHRYMTALLLGLCAIVGAFLIGTIALRRILGPVGALAKVAQRIQAGELDQKAPVASNDEIGALASAFNSMTEQLTRSMKSLQMEIEERKQAMQAMRESEARFRAIFETAADAIFVNAIDDGCFMDVNQAACLHLGYSEGELLRMTMDQILDLHSGYPNPLELQDHEATGRFFFEAVHVRNDGTRIPVEIHRGPVERHGRPAMLSIVRDVSVRKQTEQELLRYRQNLEQMVAERTRALEAAQGELVKRERLAVLGQLTATVSHELRNPLGVIRSSNFYLQRRNQDTDEKTLKHFRRIDEQVSLCDTIVGDLLEYTRGRSASLVYQALDSWLPKVIEQMQEIWGLEIGLRIAEDLPTWPHDREKMRRVVVNVLDNALQAVQSKQETPKGDPAYQPCVSLEAAKQADSVVLRCIDNGIGMDAQTCRRAFEPLFTTRARGTGIGLANVKKIVDEHRGRIELQSCPGQGTRISIFLPLNADISLARPVGDVDNGQRADGAP